ncbi:MAG: hypothetical protein QY314_04690 [Candidatus Dojkabacteria bacterium]|nr:MAG: hypothetical protein QY314_04690 [Candidatus Dojkabacteria bacterium]
MKNRVVNQKYYDIEEQILTDRIAPLPTELHTTLTSVELEERLEQAYDAFTEARKAKPCPEKHPQSQHTRHELVAKTRFGEVHADAIEVNINPHPNQQTLYFFGGGIAGADNASAEICALAAVGYRVVAIPSMLSTGMTARDPYSEHLHPLYLTQLQRYEQLYGSFSADGEIVSKLLQQDQRMLHERWAAQNEQYTGEVHMLGFSAGAAIAMRAAGQLNGKMNLNGLHLVSPAGVYPGFDYIPEEERNVPEWIDKRHYLAKRQGIRRLRVLGIAAGFGMDTIRVLRDYENRTIIVNAVGDDAIIKPHKTMPWLAHRCAENILEQENDRIDAPITIILSQKDGVFPVAKVTETANAFAQQRAENDMPAIEVITTKTLSGIDRHNHSWTSRNSMILALALRNKTKVWETELC